MKASSLIASIVPSGVLHSLFYLPAMPFKQISDRSAILKSVMATVALHSTSQGRRAFCGLPASGGFALEFLCSLHSNDNLIF